jgi:hypothetical protein
MDLLHDFQLECGARLDKLRIPPTGAPGFAIKHDVFKRDP